MERQGAGGDLTGQPASGSAGARLEAGQPASGSAGARLEAGQPASPPPSGRGQSTAPGLCTGGAEARLEAGHVVICNCNEKVRAIVEEVNRARPDLDVVLVIQDDALWDGHPEWQPRVTGPGRFVTMRGCPTDADLLRNARVGHASTVVILADPDRGALADARNVLVAVSIERENPQVRSVVELILSANRCHLEATEVNEVVCQEDIAEKLIAQSCLTPGMSRLFSHLLTMEPGTTHFFVCDVPGRLDGTSYRELARRSIVEDAPFVACGFVQASAKKDGKPVTVLNPRPGHEPGRDTVLRAGDQLIVVSSERPDLKEHFPEGALATGSPAPAGSTSL